MIKTSGVKKNDQAALNVMRMIFIMKVVPVILSFPQPPSSCSTKFPDGTVKPA
jgi:hypothetical protein